MKSPQDLTFFSTRIQDRIPRDNRRNKTENVWHVWEPQQLFIEFYEVLSGPHVFHQDPGWGPKGQPKGQKGKRLTGRKIITIFYCFFMRSPQDLIFSHQDPGWDPKGQPKEQNGERMTGMKTLATFYWILWGLIRTSLFPPGSRMGPQGATKGKKRKMSDKQNKH